MNTFFIGIYILSILLSGFAILSACEIRNEYPQWPLHKMLAFAYIIGSGVSGFLLFWIALLGLTPSRTWILILFFVSLIAFFSAKSWHLRPFMRNFQQRIKKNRTISKILNFHKPNYLNTIQKISLLIAIIAVLISFAIIILNTVFTPLWDIDSFALWGIKSKAIFFTSLNKNAYFHRVGYGFSHLEYPLLVPLLNAGTYICVGETSQTLGKLLYIPLFISFSILLYHSALERLSSIIAFGFAAILLSSPAILQWSAVGTADIYMAIFYAMTLFFSISYLETKNKFHFLLAIFADVFMVFTKNEGIPIAIINIFLLFAFTFQTNLTTKQKLTMIFSVLSVISLLIPWFLWSEDIPRIHENYPQQITKILNPENLSRIPRIALAFMSQGGDFFRWGIFWFILIASLLFPAKRSAFLFVFISLFANFALYFVIFVISPWDVNYLSISALERLLLHLSIPAYFTISQTDLISEKNA